MELVANVWPVVDSQSGLVQRFFMRAYAMEAADELINVTLRSLAPHDFRIARVFVIPEQFKFVTEHGTLTGCVTLGSFQEYQSQILEQGFAELEKGYSRLQGVAAQGIHPVGVGVIPRFPKEPYLVVTTIVEMPDGSLQPQLKNPL